MNKYRNCLPQLGNSQFLTDGGLETTLIFDNDIDLPEFAAFSLLFDDKGQEELWNYYLPYIKLAKAKGLGFILESPTWRASKEWGIKLGLSDEEILVANIRAIEMLSVLRDSFEDNATPMVISGCLGPRGDGYRIDNKMTVQEARIYHSTQIVTFSKTDADLVSAFTINYVEEAIGISLAADDQGIPVVISFTVETDGRLPSGQPLGSAIEEVDKETKNGPAYFMINCAHPTHFRGVLDHNEPWLERIMAIRANASCKSHAELDDSSGIDRGDRYELAQEYKKLINELPHLKIFGGCCGTDHHHVAMICDVINTH